MSTVQRADSAARRRAILFVVISAVMGTLLILGVERYSDALRDWVIEDPEQAPRRLKLVFAIFAAAASAPLVGFAAYLWSLGHHIVRARQFPPPGRAAARDTEIVDGQAAVSRGRALKMFAAALGVFCVLFWALLWRLASLLRPPA
jgi:hypothetical protein